MKKLLILLMIISPLLSKAQDFKPGWYIVEKGAMYGVYANGHLDYSDKGKPDNPATLFITPGECVYLWEKNSDNYIANEWFGRISIFKGIDKLTPVTATGKIAYLEKDIEDINGKVMTAGSAVWVTDFMTASKTVKVLLNDKRTYEIPAADVTMLANFIMKEATDVVYKKAN